MRGRKNARRAISLPPPLAGLAFSLCVAGCDAPENENARPTSGGATQRIVTTGPAGTGVIRGVVTFNGTPPEGEQVDGSRCHSGAKAIHVAPVAVGKDGALKDVMVYVKSPSTVPAGIPGDAVVLDQVNCQYVPHVLGVRVGQVLRVRSSDPTMHNVHTLSVENPAVNFGMTRAGESRDLTFAVPERFAVKCDVHPWMTAHVHVLDHPFFAVTGADGRFEIRGLPPGENELVFSHPFLGERERKVMVGADAVTMDVTFERGQ
jgi:plastocyanin